jgi:hypothetical protein
MSSKNIVLDGANRIQLEQFDLNRMVEDPCIALIAKRGSGKSWVIRSILKYQPNIPCGIIIAPTDKMTGFYKEFFPDLFIYYRFETDTLKQLFDRQYKMIMKQAEKEKQGKRINPKSLLVMDDCLSQKGSWIRDETIAELFYNGRHYKLTFVISMQQPLGLSPELRGNLDYIFLLASDFISIQKKIYEHYAGIFETFDLFRKAYMECTADFGCMVIDNRTKSPKIEDKVFWYKAKEEKGFLFGSEAFKRFHKQHYDENYLLKPSNYRAGVGTKTKCNVRINLSRPDTKRD